ncbi:MAG: hypothetical protein FJZ01_20590 [Candidatus Sericytochromatia bacterium]|nr:hypothetical protein [Candidatus Tanganyikabacteria bacterium]
MSKRDRAEAIVVLGRAVVEEALADLDRAARLFADDPEAVEAAVKGIRGKTAQEAREFAAGLAHETKIALAGAWIGETFTRAMERLGFEEMPE